MLCLDFCILFFTLLPSFVLLGEDYYHLLGVSKDADNREIRKAFKKLALKLHPDKNDAEDAHEKFLKINKAYEVLKDQELRKKYDMFGENEDDGGDRSRNYQSWTYYNDDFGIYDDDAEIVTLDSSEFRRSVMESHDLWFINFYSPRCGHCHDLAPVWRRLAREVSGSVRVGAINCQEEAWLCREQGVTGYPRLMLYTVGDGTKVYRGRQEVEDLVTFLASHLPERMVDLWPGNFDKWTKGPEHRYSGWLLFLCPTTSSPPCLAPNSRRLLGASLAGLTSIGMIDCMQDEDLCLQYSVSEDEGKEVDFHERPRVIFYPEGIEEDGERILLDSDVTNHKELVEEVLSLLPEPTYIDEPAFKEMQRRLEAGSGPSWLLHFVLGDVGDGLEWKKLVPLLPRMRTGKVDCEKEVELCARLRISKFPGFVVFKVSGGMEMYYSKPRLEEVASFARLSSQARTMQSLTPDMFPAILQQSIVIDFFTPWCPPCLNLLPEFRKASTFIGGSILFGTVDCSLHSRLCNQHGVRAYPTTVFFNSSKPHRYQGAHSARELADFVEDTLRPSVRHLTAETFASLVGRKGEEEIWVVDFFAPWCGPCMALAPEWRKLARSLANIPQLHVGQVDCEAEKGLCDSQAISSYPSIRLYPTGRGSAGRYNPLPGGVGRDSASLEKWVLSQLPSRVDNLTPYSFKMQVLGSSQPWLVDFFTPWCGHCSRFAPTYEQVALALQGEVKVGKVDCERYQQLCRKEGVSGYPTIRFYRGSDTDEEHYFEDIKSMDPKVIMEQVDMNLKQSSGEENDIEDFTNNKHDEL